MTNHEKQNEHIFTINHNAEPDGQFDYLLALVKEAAENIESGAIISSDMLLQRMKEIYNKMLQDQDLNNFDMIQYVMALFNVVAKVALHETKGESVRIILNYENDMEHRSQPSPFF